MLPKTQTVKSYLDSFPQWLTARVPHRFTLLYHAQKGTNIDKGKFIALWKQEDGRWKLFREIGNSDNSPLAQK